MKFSTSGKSATSTKGQTSRNSSPCSSSPCSNGATCVNVNADTFICVCRGGFFGVTCDNSEYCYIDKEQVKGWSRIRPPLRISLFQLYSQTPQSAPP